MASVNKSTTAALVGGIGCKPERRGEVIAASASTFDAGPGPGYRFQASVWDARLTANARCVLSSVQPPQCPFNLDNGLQIALQLAHRHFAVSASGRHAGVIVGVWIHRQFIARTVDTILVDLQFSKQALAKYFEITPALALSGVGFGFHRSRFP
jgi:hypothetical protein